MTYDEFRRHLGKGRMKIKDFADLIGVRASSISNYAKKDEVPQSYAVIAVLAGELVDRHIDTAELLRRHGVARQMPARFEGVAHLADFRNK